MNFKIIAMNLIVPVTVILAIGVIAGCFGLKKKESIKEEVFAGFKQDWEAEENPKEADVFRKFFRMFVQAYEYEKYKENANKLKYLFYKLLVLSVILCIPFLVLFLITGKEWILNNSEWNDIYLYTVILVPLVFAFLVNQYIRIRQYHEIWYRHLRNRHFLEWRMIVFIKDYELLKAGLSDAEPGSSSEKLKVSFINDICEFWKAASEISQGESKEENIFAEIGSLFSKG